MTLDEAIEQFKYDAECNRADLDLSYAEDNEQVAEWLKELKQYRAIGTPDECRAAVEKQTAKKVIKYADGTEHCPACDCDNSCIGYGVCIDCGQKLDWSDEE